MRHLVVGQSCPADGSPAGRTHCSTCPAFVSYRASGGVATIGCAWGQDVADWLRREMRSHPNLPPPAFVTTVVPARSVAGQLPGPAVAGTPRAGTCPSADGAVRRRGLLGRMSLIFVAAFGVGVALSAYDRG